MKKTVRSKTENILHNQGQDYSQYDGLSLNKAKLNDSELEELTEELGLNSEDIFGTGLSRSDFCDDGSDLEELKSIMGGKY